MTRPAAVATKLTLEVVFLCASPREARSLQAAFAPDNKSVPKDQDFSWSLQGDELHFKISSSRASGCVSSALSLLSDAKLFQDIWPLPASRLSSRA